MVTIGTIILMVILYYLLVVNKNVKQLYVKLITLTVIVELLIERGYFLQIGDQQIAYRTVVEFILCLISIILVLTRRINIRRANFKRFSFFLLCLLIGWFSLTIFPSKATGGTMEVSWDIILTTSVGRQEIVFNNSMWLEIIQILMYLVIALVSTSYLNVDDWKESLEYFVKYSRGILCFCSIEIITKYLLKSSIFTTLIDSIVGVSKATVLGLSQRGNGYILCGLTKEASHYVFVLFILFLIYFCLYTAKKDNVGKKVKRQYKLSFGLILLNFICSMSFSGIYFGICAVLFIWCIYFEKRGNSSIKLLLTAFLTLCFLVLLVGIFPIIASKLDVNSFWGRRLLSISEEIQLLKDGGWLKASTALEWSTRVRLGSTYETLLLLKYRPLFGLGFASVSAHSSFLMLLTGCGAVGFVAYCKMAYHDIYVKNKSLYYSLVIIFLLSTVLNSLALRPFYECWSILLIVCFKMICKEIDRRPAMKSQA